MSTPAIPTAALEAAATGTTVRLFGGVQVAGPAGVVETDGFPGTQARVVLAFLVLERAVPVPIERLADVVWSPQPPLTWRPALRTVITRVRRSVATADPDALLVAGPAGYRLHLTEPVQVDVEVARLAARHAEQALASGDIEVAVARAAEAEHLIRAPFLPRAEGPWVDGIRDDLRNVHVRVLHVLGECHLLRGEPGRAARAATEAIALGPIGEASHRLSMRALAAAGEKGRAAEAFERCRRVLADELGVDPSPQTRELLVAILRE